MAALSERGLRCIGVDRRGCGRSSRPGHGYDFDTLADDLAAVLDALDLTDVTLVAHSIGACEAARYLSRHGAGRIARVALVGTMTPFIGEAVPPDAFDEMIGALGVDRGAYLAAAAPAFFGTEVSPEMLAWGVGLAMRSSLKATIELVRTFSTESVRDDLAAFTMPTLLLHGAADQTAPLEATARPTVEAIPHAELRVYETGHGLFVTERERLDEDLLAFARQQPRAGALA
jgi:pimeloyl-ACP methyl ester carboxylesterase